MAANAPLQRQRVAALGRGFSVGFVRADQHHRETPTVPEGTGTHHYSRIVFNYFRPVYNTRVPEATSCLFISCFIAISRVRETGSRARSPRKPMSKPWHACI